MRRRKEERVRVRLKKKRKQKNNNTKVVVNTQIKNFSIKSERYFLFSFNDKIPSPLFSNDQKKSRGSSITQFVLYYKHRKFKDNIKLYVFKNIYKTDRQYIHLLLALSAALF